MAKRGCKTEDISSIQERFRPTYLKILALVKAGDTIDKACLIVGIDRTTLYKNMDKQQKSELKFYKAEALIKGIYRRDKQDVFIDYQADADDM